MAKQNLNWINVSKPFMKNNIIVNIHYILGEKYKPVKDSKKTEEIVDFPQNRLWPLRK